MFCIIGDWSVIFVYLTLRILYAFTTSTHKVLIVMYSFHLVVKCVYSLLEVTMNCDNIII